MLSEAEWNGVVQIIAFCAAGVGIGTFVKGVLEYSQENRRKRAEQFLSMRKKFKENPKFTNICNLLEDDDPQLITISFADKREFLGFFEEIALMLNSKLIKKEVAHYMFGYYPIKCYNSKNFWNSINKNSVYWKEFIQFSKAMLEIEGNSKKKSKIKL